MKVTLHQIDEKKAESCRGEIHDIKAWCFFLYKIIGNKLSKDNFYRRFDVNEIFYTANTNVSCHALLSWVYGSSFESSELLVCLAYSNIFLFLSLSKTRPRSVTKFEAAVPNSPASTTCLATGFFVGIPPAVFEAYDGSVLSANLNLGFFWASARRLA